MKALAIALSILLPWSLAAQSQLDLPSNPDDDRGLSARPSYDGSGIAVQPDETLRDALASPPVALADLPARPPAWMRKPTPAPKPENEPEDETERQLKNVRSAGGAAAGAGVGVATYAFVIGAAAGPIGWAASVIFVGGMTAYLAQRRLAGHDDFSPYHAVPGPVPLPALERQTAPYGAPPPAFSVWPPLQFQPAPVPGPESRNVPSVSLDNHHGYPPEPGILNYTNFQLLRVPYARPGAIPGASEPSY